jgi:drug/metabolite transporter (DMT)-like permease
VNATQRRIRLGIVLVAAVVFAGLFLLKRAGVDEALLQVLAIGGALLVTMLFVTYRALLKVVEAARDNPHPPPPDDEDDEDDR